MQYFVTSEKSNKIHDYITNKLHSGDQCRVKARGLLQITGSRSGSVAEDLTFLVNIFCQLVNTS